MNATIQELLKAIKDCRLREYRFQNVECKRSWKQESGKNISALGNRNRSGPSFLVVGIEDDGQLSGRDESWLKTEEEKISGHLNQYLDPSQACIRVEPYEYFGGAFIVLHIENPGTVVRWNNKAYKGAGTTKAEMTPHEEMELTLTLPGTTDFSARSWHGKLDQELVRQFIAKLLYRRPDMPFSLSDIETDPDPALSYLRLAATNVAAVLFGPFEFRVVMYDRYGDPAINESRRGLYRLLSGEVVRETQGWSKAQSNGRFQPLSERALREAIANAVAHAAYFEHMGDIILEVHPDRVEVSNLCLPEAAHFANRWFSKSHHTFNALLMESLRLVGVVDELGRGKTLIYTETAQVCNPVPGEDALHGQHHVAPVRLDHPDQILRCSRHIPVCQHLSFIVHDADIHRPCVKVDTAVELMLLSVESHNVSSSCMDSYLRQLYSITRGGLHEYHVIRSDCQGFRMTLLLAGRSDRELWEGRQLDSKLDVFRKT